MKQTVNVLVVEDNEYYNSFIFNALQQSIHFVQTKLKYKLIHIHLQIPPSALKKLNPVNS